MNSGKTAILAAISLFLFYALLILSLLTFLEGPRFLEVLSAPDTLFAVHLSVIAATLAMLLAIAIGLPAAYALSRFQFPGKKIVDTLLELPLIMSPVALGAALLVFFNTPFGKAIQEKGVLFVFEFPGIVLAQFATIAGLATRLMKTALDEISPRYEAVARSLGSNAWEAFRKITLPLSFRGILSAMILCWAKAVGEFGATVMLAGTMAFKTETMPIAIFMSLASADIPKTIILILILAGIGLTALFAVRLVEKRPQVL
ncbi:MAG: ABC transporter permease [Deltaproteobacteria bacterium SM23_61]|nr:MAG: ABC transporter permease [Deltaproteobacteria bacterium SM23_61]